MIGQGSIQWLSWECLTYCKSANTCFSRSDSGYQIDSLDDHNSRDISHRMVYLDNLL